MKKATTYTPAYKALHWLTALLIIGLLCVGLYMADYAPKELRPNLYGLHKATGIVLLMVVLARSAYRLSYGTPKLLACPRWQHRLAHATHAALWLCMFAMPLSGWVMSSAGGHPISFYGLFTVPPLVPKGFALGGFAHEVHEVLPNILWALIALHVAGAAYHHFVKRDTTLKRMLP